jgi:ABC-type polysaccharide/polyol phosphate export permease
MIQNTRRLFYDLAQYKETLWQLIIQHLTLRYRRTILGYFWTLLSPLLMISIVAVVFSSLFKAELSTFAIFLFSGMIPWNLFNAVVTQSATVLIQNEGLLKKIYLPKILFPLGLSIALLIDGLFSFVALFLVIIAVGGKITAALWFIPVAYLILFFFALGFGLLTSVATVYFRDLQHVLLIGMQGLFFFTPILYKQDNLSGLAAQIVNLNPVVPFIDLFRFPLVSGLVPPIGVITIALIISLTTFLIGLCVFMTKEARVIFRL